MTCSVFIDGAEGTTGLEIRDRLLDKPGCHLHTLPEEQRKDAAARRDALTSSDFAILCLPDDAAREAAGWAEGTTTRIIDASSAHRLADDWTYGFPELVGENAVANAAKVSNPGCYATGFLALIAPLVKAGLLPADLPYTVNAVSGFSGGGKALIERFADDPAIAFRAYGFALDHKHLPEMQHYAGLAHPPVFAPAVVPAYRGMHVEVPLPLAAMNIAASPHELRATLTEFFAASERIAVHADTPAELLLRTDREPSDSLNLWVLADLSGTQARLVAQLDNLGKGASGAAVQSLELMAGSNHTKHTAA